MLKAVTMGLFVGSFFLFKPAFAGQTATNAPPNQKIINERFKAYWPVFDKAQLQDLALGKKTYQKNPITGEGEFFYVPKDLTPEEEKAYKAFKDDIDNAQSGALQPGLEDNHIRFNHYDSSYGKIRIEVTPGFSNPNKIQNQAEGAEYDPTQVKQDSFE